MLHYLIPEKSARLSAGIGYLFCVLVAASYYLACRHFAPGLESSPAKTFFIGAVMPIVIAVFASAMAWCAERTEKSRPSRPKRVVQVTELLRPGPSACFYALILCVGLAAAWLDARLLCNYLHGPFFAFTGRVILGANLVIGPGVFVWPWLAWRGYGFPTTYIYALAANGISMMIALLFAFPFFLSIWRF
jgi:hypothetical protein